MWTSVPAAGAVAGSVWECGTAAECGGAAQVAIGQRAGMLVKRTSANGLATFGDLVLSQPGRYRLVARLGNGLQVLSRAIAVS
ncbi:MAG: hypothetical protein N3E46_11775 [Gemmataceae bacterium]|nr:hypothetical protein [Gemmataceae bacterium]